MNPYIYTDIFFVPPTNLITLKCFALRFIKVLLGIPSKGGHPSVYQSLIESDKYNHLCLKNKLPPEYKKSNIACVLSSPSALKLVLSKRYLFSKLIVGPNVFTTPFDFRSLPLDDAIDGYIVPSLAIKKYYQSYLSHLGINKDFFVWPANPSRIYTEPHNLDGSRPVHILFYIKYSSYFDNTTMHTISTLLNNQSVPFSFIFYGRYCHDEYLSLLRKSTHVFFMGIGESQCIAQFEAAALGCKIFVLQESRFKQNPLVHIYPYYLADCAPYASMLNINILTDMDSLYRTLTDTDFSAQHKPIPLSFPDSFSTLLASLASYYD